MRYRVVIFAAVVVLAAITAVWAANIGSEAAANAIVIKVVFMAFFSLAGPAARSQFHLAAGREKTR